MTDNDIKFVCEKIESLHEKILKSKFAETVTESEMLSLILAVRGLNDQKAEIERLEEEKDKFIRKYEESTNGKRNIKFETGDYAKIVGNHSGHEFEIGTIVKLEKGDEDYKAFANNDYWWVTDVDLTEINNSSELLSN